MAPQPHSPRTQSPLTRGKHPAWILRVIASRLIPAHAGKTRCNPRVQPCVAAHPRSRGENSGLRLWLSARSGSSPLTRGKRGGGRLARWGGRLIPAHAGKTILAAVNGSSLTAHPRSRGENFEETSLLASCPGPSPLTRGKPQLLADGLVQARLIPAHAGKTTCRRASSVATSAHPRSRGENPILAHDGGRLDGSSPLTRGKRDLPLSESLAEGLIPAHAGKTSGRPSPTGAAAAHPRSRGENANSGRPAVSFAGSSPLTRGKRADDALRLSNPGLIPAHAGKTDERARRAVPHRAHPRSRGENS